MVLKKDKLIKDIRVDFEWKTDGLFFGYKSPYYFGIYEEIFINLLKQKGFTCNNYNHIYIKASEDKNIEIYKQDNDFFKYGAVSFSKDKYKNGCESIKDNMALNCVYEGLIDLAKRDGLDIDMISQVYKEIQDKGIDTQLIFKEVDHKLYNLKIIYSPKNPHLYTLFFLLTDKENNKTIMREINKGGKDFMYEWLQTVTLTSKSIKIKPTQSSKSSLYGDKKNKFEINIIDFINDNNFKCNYKEYKPYTQSNVVEYKSKKMNLIKKIISLFK